MCADHLWVDLTSKLSHAKLCILITIFDSVPTYNLYLVDSKNLSKSKWVRLIFRGVWFKPDVCGSFMDRFEVQIVTCKPLHSYHNFCSVPTSNLCLIWKTFQSLDETGWFLGGFGLSQMCADHLWIDLKSKLSRAKLCIPITMEQRTNASKCVGLAVLTACELFHWIHQNCLQFFITDYSLSDQHIFSSINSKLILSDLRSFTQIVLKFKICKFFWISEQFEKKKFFGVHKFKYLQTY